MRLSLINISNLTFAYDGSYDNIIVKAILRKLDFSRTKTAYFAIKQQQKRSRSRHRYDYYGLVIRKKIHKFYQIAADARHAENVSTCQIW